MPYRALASACRMRFHSGAFSPPAAATAAVVLILAPILCLPRMAGAQVVIADAVRLTHADGPGVAELIVDNGAPGFFTAGTWTARSNASGYEGDYLWASASDSNPAMAVWQFDVVTTGDYDVAVWYGAGSNRSAAVHYRVQTADGMATATLDQTTGGNWTPLGRFPFVAGAHLVHVSTAVSPDLAGDLIVDDGDSLFSTTGSWTLGTTSPGYQDDYLYTSCAAVGSKAAQWSFPILIAANYEISVFFSPGGNRTDDAIYRLVCGAEAREIRVNQTIGLAGWRRLAALPIQPGMWSLTLLNQGPADKVVIADAMRARSLGTGPIPPEIDPHPFPDRVATPKGGDPIAVAAGVTSTDPLAAVFCEQRLTTGGLATISLADDGLHDDGVAGDGIFGGLIPGGPADTVVEYRFGARTTANGEAHSNWLKCLVACDAFTSPEMRLVFGYSITTPERIDSQLERVRAGNFNTLCFSVRNVGDAAYQSSYEPPMVGVPEGFDPLAYMVEKAHDTTGGKARIDVHPVVLVYRVSTTDTPPPDHVLSLHPEWASEDFSGERFTLERLYLDPGVPEVQDYLINVFMEIVGNYDIDGFNLDTIRYNQANLGYNATALSYFHEFTGRTDRPLYTDLEWSAWRRGVITDFVRRLQANILKAKPHVVLTVDGVSWPAVKPAIEDNHFYAGVYQDYPLWLRDHAIDGVLGMAYIDEDTPTGAQDFRDWQAFLQGHSAGRNAVAIVGGYRNTIPNGLVQLHHVRKSGSNWLAFYSDSSSNTTGASAETFYAAARSQLFPTAVPVPQLPWKTNPPTGTLMGFVRAGSEPGRRLRVVLDGGRETLSDLCGFYVFFEVEPGAITATAHAMNNAAQSATATIHAGAVTELDIEFAAEVDGFKVY